jgi:hypothetical protein
MFGQLFFAVRKNPGTLPTAEVLGPVDGARVSAQVGGQEIDEIH